jgi:hypothetical protein
MAGKKYETVVKKLDRNKRYGIKEACALRADV